MGLNDLCGFVFQACVNAIYLKLILVTVPDSPRYRGYSRVKNSATQNMLKGVTMKLKIILSSLVILTAVFLSAFGSPAAPQTVKLQDTVAPPAVTVVPPTVVVVEGTPNVIPVTGGD